MQYLVEQTCKQTQSYGTSLSPPTPLQMTLLLHNCIHNRFFAKFLRFRRDSVLLSSLHFHRLYSDQVSSRNQARCPVLLLGYKTCCCLARLPPKRPSGTLSALVLFCCLDVLRQSLQGDFSYSFHEPDQATISCCSYSLNITPCVLYSHNPLQVSFQNCHSIGLLKLCRPPHPDSIQHVAYFLNGRNLYDQR